MQRFNYADAMGILGIGCSVSESVVVLPWEVDDLLDWANNNAVFLNTQNSEVIQFSSRFRVNPVGTQVSSINIKPEVHIR